jgi:8-oxo-dGTP diphosphatase
MPLARFVAFHATAEAPSVSSPGPLRFALVLARAPEGVMLVFNRYRQVWELPGGLIDAGESARAAAARELSEEAGAETAALEWLGITEVDDGTRHFGAVFRGDVIRRGAVVQNDEIDGVAYWRPDAWPEPLGQTDAALLARFG